MDWLTVQVSKIESDINICIEVNPTRRQGADLVRSVPGCGPKLVARFLDFIGDICRFNSAKALAALVGVTPGCPAA